MQDGGSDEQSANAGAQSAGKGRFLQFWTSLPGVLTGLAAVITAAVTLFALIQGDPKGDSQHQQPVAAESTASTDAHAASPPQTTPTVAGPVTSARAPSTTLPATLPPDNTAIRKQGTLSTPFAAQVSLVSGQTGDSIPNPDFEVDNGLITPGKGNVATLGTIANPASCSRALANGGSIVGTMVEGVWLCLATADGHLAAFSEKQESASDGYVIKFVIWDIPA